MKKALALTILLVFGVGLIASAGMSGTWGAEISIDPGAVIAGDLFVDLTSSLDVDYTLGDWVFGATSGFDRLGWSSMSFDAVGVLGAFSFTGVMNFLPRTITAVSCVYDFPQTPSDPALFAEWDECWYGDAAYLTYTYGAAFDDLMFTAAVSIAGVSFEGLFYLEGYEGDAECAPLAFYWNGTVIVQTAGETLHYLGDAADPTDTGSGFRFSLSGTAGGLTITSLTYFSLDEPFATITCGAESLSKKGSGFTVDGCAVGFESTYLHIDGFTVGCATFEVGLNITCDGFDWVAFAAHDIGLGVWGLVGDFSVKFTETQKSVDFCLDFELDVVCFEIGATLDYEDYVVGGFSIDSLVLDTALNGVTLVSTTYFDGEISQVSAPGNQMTFLVPFEGLVDNTPVVADSTADPTEIEAISNDTTGVGYYNAVCVDTEYWSVWETFEISVDGDSCCGGGFEFAIEVGMGTKMDLDYFAWNYQFDDETTDAYFEYLYQDLEDGDVDYTIGLLGGLLGGDADGDGDVDTIDYSLISGATYDEQLLDETVYDATDSDSLFSWVYTNVDLSVDLGTAWALTFGAAIDVYGWDALTFGFEFTF